MNQLKFILASILFFSSSTIGQQVADTGFNYNIEKPIYKKGTGTVIILDEAHINFHTLGGRYYAFGKLLQNDGYVLKPGVSPFTPSYLSTIKILAVANALADTGEWKLPANPAFTKDEISAVQKWVSTGGSLFLIADHMPFSGAAQQLALAFGFNFINGFAVRKDGKPEFFSRKKKTLNPSIITNGRNKSEQVDSIMIFTGQAFIAPQNATIISLLSDDYTILLPSKAWEFRNDTTAIMSGHGFVNGAFMEYGKGRIVVMGEAALFSAQLAGPEKRKMGMNNPAAKQNPRFLLNIIHWLDRKL